MAAVTGALIVDTHFILWQRIKPQFLTRAERDLIDNASVRHISVVSLWEIAMLFGLGRVPADDQLLEVPQGFDLLPVGLHHCRAYAILPPHHRDPFDRMLLAQAQSEQIPLLTRDRAMAAYHGQVTILP
ncbi:MAG TPA: type II toxin-antitoxin system VapC family toxin [Stellaceae bacterium]|nr:type II toxin-antitoxin system VapC family toxin [Stellaceae bacterium]